jgi:toxin CcdB
MQHDVFANPAPRTRAAFPFVAVLQADLSAESRSRMVAPMAPRGAMMGAVGRLMPIVQHDGHEFLLAMELMTSVPVSALRNPLGSIAARRDDITRAVDWLFIGI